MLGLTFYALVSRPIFEGKERRLFLKGIAIQQQQKSLLNILDKIPDALLVVKPNTHEVLFSNLQARKVFNHK